MRESKIKFFLLVAKLDIASDSGSEDWGFESLRAGQFFYQKVLSTIDKSFNLLYNSKRAVSFSMSVQIYHFKVGE